MLFLFEDDNLLRHHENAVRVWNRDPKKVVMTELYF